MGITTSTQEVPPRNNNSEGDSSAPDSTKSATVIVVGSSTHELVADIASEIADDSVGFATGRKKGTKGTKLPFSFGPGFPGGSGGPGGGIPPDDVAASFKLENIGGLDTQIEYLKRAVILPMAQPKMLKEWGVSPPKGILLHGPPGCGKTYVAKSLVNEIKKVTGSHVNFFYRKGGDVFSRYYGESQRKLREVFDSAKAITPSVIFFDELDGLCPSRDGASHGTQAYKTVVTCFLGEMDALEPGKVFVIGATNRLDAIDPAVRRPGRFDKHLAFSFPDEQGRHKILTIYTSKWSKADRPENQLVQSLAKKTIGFSGADLEKLCKDVVYIAIEENNGVITEQMKIKRHHWDQALNGMRRTESSSFGSSLLSPTRPTDVVSTLVQPVVTAAVQKIQPLFGSSYPSSNSPTFRKNLLLTITELQSNTFLNNPILQGILSEPLFNSATIYDLSMESIQNKIIMGRKHTILTVVHDVITQALDSTTPAVLLIPNINELITSTQILKYQLISALARIRGPQLFLLATSSLPLSLVQEPQLNQIFNGNGRVMSVENPKKSQLIQFYKTIPNASQLPVAILNKLANDAAHVADNDNFEDVLNLYDALAMALPPQEEGGKKTKKQQEELQEEIETILENYKTSKLR